jgi:hypothetical protein
LPASLLSCSPGARPSRLAPPIHASSGLQPSPAPPSLRQFDKRHRRQRSAVPPGQCRSRSSRPVAYAAPRARLRAPATRLASSLANGRNHPHIRTVINHDTVYTSPKTPAMVLMSSNSFTVYSIILSINEILHVNNQQKM